MEVKTLDGWLYFLSLLKGNNKIRTKSEFLFVSRL